MADTNTPDLLIAHLPPDPEPGAYHMMVPYSLEWVNWLLSFQSREMIRLLHTSTVGKKDEED